MPKRKEREDLKNQILEAAWELFREKGYENTTVNDIIKRAGTSKGGFYYYFKAKEELLNMLYSIFDKEYEKFYTKMDKSMNSFLQLKLISQCVCYFIETNVSVELLSAMYQWQLTEKVQDGFWGDDRYYLKILKEIISQGQERGEIRKDMSVSELAHHVLLLERGILVDWCVRNGEFSIGHFGSLSFDCYLEFMKA